MVEIRLRNSRSRQVERFDPLDPDNVRMYLCGPTVYDRAHLGNARNVIMFDVLFRLLRQVYGSEHVTYVRNFTDVDDKINATALARKEAGATGTLEDLVKERSEETIAWYLQDMDALGNLRPDHMPRATEYIAEMVAMIETLINKRFAYVVRAESNDPPQEYVLADRERMLGETALFEVDSWREQYGKLSGRSVEDMIAGARVEVAPHKRNPMDFVLWKPSTDELPGWDSPWGRGRPGWHIECSAMSKALLGDTFDIHGGGNDLMFPHHENERAQSCCANGTDFMAQVWMHNEMLQVEGKKMSKSLGNFFTVRDLLDQGVPGEVIRFVFLSTHYSKPMDWTEKKAKEAAAELHQWHKATMDLVSSPETAVDVSSTVLDALRDDLNTHEALQVVRRMRNDPQRLLDHARFLGFLDDASREAFKENWLRMSAGHSSDRNLAYFAQSLDRLRKDAMQTKDFSQVDALKTALTLAGATIKMTRDGVTVEPGPDFDASKLEGLE